MLSPNQNSEGVPAQASEATGGAVAPVSDWQTYKRLLSYVAPHWHLLVVSILGFLAAASAEAYFGSLLGDLINDWDNAAIRNSAIIPMFMLGAALVRGAGSIVGEALISRVSFSVVYAIRSQLFEQLLKLPSAFYDNNAQGHLVSRLTFTVAQMRDTGTDAIRTIIQDGIKVIVLFGAMLFLNWKLTLLFLATVPVLAVVVVFAGSRFRKISRRIQNSMGDVTHVVSETVSGYKVVRTFGGQKYEDDRFDKHNRTNRQQNMKMAVTKVFSAQLNEITISLAICVLILLLYDTDMTSGDAVTFMTWAGLLGRPIKKLSEVNAKLQRGLAAAHDVFSQLDEQVETDTGTKQLQNPRGDIHIDNVSFHYGDGQVVLDNISLEIKSGQTVALVGRSGSGKSTLANLIPRFYEITEGRILLDGHDIREYQLQSLRHHIAFVSQQVTLFNDTLRNNVAYGALAACSPAQVNAALDKAYATEFVEQMTDGVDTLLGDDGVRLSGGQRQRIAIARALLKDAPLLILDEATSALDNESERYIQAALDEVMQNRTTLVIAHRLSTIEAADLIVVMDRGSIAEQGTHEELLAQKGLYAELHSAQFSEEQMTDGATAEPVWAGKTPDLPAAASYDASGVSRAWYTGAWWVPLLSPLSGLYNFFRKRRARPYERGTKVPQKAGIPVIVVGNVTVGGTGKTPLVSWMVERLRERGYNPGIVMRGYRGKLSKSGTLVPSGADPDRYSDEAVQLRDRLGCPVAISAKRFKGVRLLEAEGCDIVVSDDGLQHLAMARDIEIAVVDGNRGLGNGYLLPAGPLREPASRLESVDWVVSNGRMSGLVSGEMLMRMRPDCFVNVATDQQYPCQDFAREHPFVHAMCGIGNPSRFYQSLQGLGMDFNPHTFADHYEYTADDILVPGKYPVVCTEKDAAKLKHLEVDLGHVWYLKVSVVLPAFAEEKLDSLLAQRNINPAAIAAKSDVDGALIGTGEEASMEPSNDSAAELNGLKREGVEEPVSQAMPETDDDRSDREDSSAVAQHQPESAGKNKAPAQALRPKEESSQ